MCQMENNYGQHARINKWSYIRERKVYATHQHHSVIRLNNDSNSLLKFKQHTKCCTGLLPGLQDLHVQVTGKHAEDYFPALQLYSRSSITIRLQAGRKKKIQRTKKQMSSNLINNQVLGFSPLHVENTRRQTSLYAQILFFIFEPAVSNRMSASRLCL